MAKKVLDKKETPQEAPVAGVEEFKEREEALSEREKFVLEKEVSLLEREKSLLEREKEVEENQAYNLEYAKVLEEKENALLEREKFLEEKEAVPPSYDTECFEYKGERYRFISDAPEKIRVNGLVLNQEEIIKDEDLLFDLIQGKSNLIEKV